MSASLATTSMTWAIPLAQAAALETLAVEVALLWLATVGRHGNANDRRVALHELLWQEHAGGADPPTVHFHLTLAGCHLPYGRPSPRQKCLQAATCDMRDKTRECSSWRGEAESHRGQWSSYPQPPREGGDESERNGGGRCSDHGQRQTPGNR